REARQLDRLGNREPLGSERHRDVGPPRRAKAAPHRAAARFLVRLENVPSRHASLQGRTMKLSLKEHLRRGVRLMRDSAYRKRSRERERLGRLPRFTPALTTLLGEPFEIVDSLSFLEMYEDIWEREAYRFPRTGEKPVVLDGGANV